MEKLRDARAKKFRDDPTAPMPVDTDSGSYLEQMGLDSSRISPKGKPDELPLWDRIQNRIWADDRYTGARISRNYDKARGIVDKSGDYVTVEYLNPLTGQTELIPVISQETKMRLAVGDAATGGHNLQYGLKSGLTNQEYVRGDFFEGLFDIAQSASQNAPVGERAARADMFLKKTGERMVAEVTVGLHDEAMKALPDLIKALDKPGVP
jgi:hypothetical protein